VLADGLILKSQAQLAASLAADWSPGQLASVRRLLGAVEARARALRLSLLSWPAEQAEAAEAATERFLARGATRRPTASWPRRATAGPGRRPGEAGVGPVSVAQPEFAFEPSSRPRTAWRPAWVYSFDGFVKITDE